MEKSNMPPAKHRGNILYIVIIVAVTAVLFALGQWVFAAALAVAFVAVTIFNSVYEKIGLSRMMNYLESFSPKLKSAETESMAGFPFPVAVLTRTGKISWYNMALQNALGGELLFQRDIKTIVHDFETEKVRDEGFKTKTTIMGKPFEILAHRISSSDDDDTVFVYFIDISEAENMMLKYKNERPVEMIISVDNFDEVIKNAPEEEKPLIGSAIERILICAANDAGAVIKRTEREKYFMFLSAQAFEGIVSKKFALLDAVRDLKPSLAVAPTLSIGVGTDGATLEETDAFAAAALDMALGRGGDQAVIRDGVSFRYYGGKTREVEKRTRVKARVVAHALRELIAQNEQVIIMGHKGADNDCVGAGVGLLAYARRSGVRAHMVIGASEKTVADIIAQVRSEEIMQNAFIRHEYAREIISANTLLIILDTHKKSLAEYPELLKHTNQIAVIDHHRRASDYIENPVLLYHEPYASSTCEMVTEMLQYMSDRPFLTAVQAKAMYSGIYLDTKGFTFKTGVRTLEAAAFLRRCGADPMAVKNLFRNDFQTYLKKTQLVSGAQIYRETMAIASTDERIAQSLVAQAADELVGISGINTSFVVAMGNGKVIISARSTGEINVQVILEKLGGGGHLSVAGVQLENISVPDAVERLKSAIDEYIAE